MRVVWQFAIIWLLLGCALASIAVFAHAFEPILGYTIVTLVVGWPAVQLLRDLDA